MVALYDIRSGNRAGPILQLPGPHGANIYLISAKGQLRYTNKHDILVIFWRKFSHCCQIFLQRYFLIARRITCSEHILQRIDKSYTNFYESSQTRLSWSLRVIFPPFGSKLGSFIRILDSLSSAHRMHDFTDFRQPNFTKFKTQHVNRCRDESFRNRILKVFPSGIVFQKNVKIDFSQHLATSGRHNSGMIIDRRKFITKWYLLICFHFYC